MYITRAIYLNSLCIEQNSLLIFLLANYTDRQQQQKCIVCGTFRLYMIFFLVLSNITLFLYTPDLLADFLPLPTLHSSFLPKITLSRPSSPVGYSFLFSPLPPLLFTTVLSNEKCRYFCSQFINHNKAITSDSFLADKKLHFNLLPNNWLEMSLSMLEHFLFRSNVGIYLPLVIVGKIVAFYCFPAFRMAFVELFIHQGGKLFFPCK